ncbi:hypothetical protein B9N43_11950 [Denitratisoma sp. DHT3]|uniref:hypothetical protein n=1 Tax=Denitratisoma sp. DHT3 TaxID=1981880 RepID=UPI00119851F5|nr:hypothetical protein [Denitratisoma sp. DHT3]QDX81903.1 hypothetical protein B9N43_11950 [Denitratisoma sp. DHT3]
MSVLPGSAQSGPVSSHIQAVLVLVGAGHLSLAQDDIVIGKARKQCDRLNAHLMHKARGGNDVSYLASPVTGGGIAVSRFEQLFLLALSQGRKQPSEWAQFIWGILSMQGQRIMKEGKTLESAEENLVELTAQAQTFAEKRLPIMKVLQIAA